MSPIQASWGGLGRLYPSERRFPSPTQQTTLLPGRKRYAVPQSLIRDPGHLGRPRAQHPPGRYRYGHQGQQRGDTEDRGEPAGWRIGTEAPRERVAERQQRGGRDGQPGTEADGDDQEGLPACRSEERRVGKERR